MLHFRLAFESRYDAGSDREQQAADERCSNLGTDGLNIETAIADAREHRNGLQDLLPDAVADETGENFAEMSAQP
jgi:hypothetical protein